MPELDARLVAAFREGEERAYGQLWARHRGLAYAIARRTDPWGDADDSVSDAFTSVLAAMRSGGGPQTSFRSYMAISVRRAAIAQAQQRRVLPASLDLDEHEVLHVRRDPLHEMSVRETLAQLPKRWRIALELTTFGGYDLAAVADRMGISYGAAAVLLTRARQRFRDLWETPEPTMQ